MQSLDDANSLERRDIMSREDGARIGSPRSGANGGQILRMMQGVNTAKTSQRSK